MWLTQGEKEKKTRQLLIDLITDCDFVRVEIRFMIYQTKLKPIILALPSEVESIFSFLE